jgi:predicted ABC-type ATPase
VPAASGARPTGQPSRIYVLAGCNGAGKSSIGGEAFRAAGVEFFNPDRAAQRILAANAARPHPPGQREVNSAAWHEGRRLLERAIAEKLNFAFETTLGGATMTQLLQRASTSGIEVRVWFTGLATPELHVERVRRRVAKGGHDIPEADIRRRYDSSRINVIRLLPGLTELRVFDNSAEGDPDAGIAPRPSLVMHWRQRRIDAPADLSATPAWAKPIVAAALRIAQEA